MTRNRRIALNIAATYGRSLVALVCGLISGRWVLMTLGVVDYGIFGLISGLVVFVTFLNTILSGAVARFYALSVGKGDLAECRRWFSTAVSVHTVVPVLLMAVGYPLGVYAIGHWLTIPVDRVGDAIWVWRFTCVGAFATMVNVPFNAMFVAKQRFGEISLYGIVATVVNVGVLYFMVTHPGAWLVRLAAWCCVLTTVPVVVVMIRACRIFDECRLVRAHLWNGEDIRKLGAFVGWMTLCGFSWLVRSSGMTVLVNKLFGPARNASLAVANTAADHAASLTASLQSVFQPAITSAYGRGDGREVANLVDALCKFSVLALLPFAIPLALEIDEVMSLWLKYPPDGAQSLCVWILAAATVNRMTAGLWTVLEASGCVAVWTTGECVLVFGGLVVAGGLAVAGLGLDAIGIAMVLTVLFICALHVTQAWRCCGIRPVHWIVRIAFPLLAVAVVAVAAGCLPRLFLERSFGRVCVTTVVADLVLAVSAWAWVLDAAERATVRRLIKRAFTGQPCDSH